MDIIEELKKINASQQAQIEELIRQNQILTEQVKYLRNKLYGHSSEKSIDDGQTSLFDDASNGVFEDPESTGEQIEIVTVRKKKKQSQKAKITKNLPIKEELIELAEHNCHNCGNAYQIFKRLIGDKFHFQPAQAYIVRRYQEVGKCQHCSEDVNYDGDQFVSATVPQSFMAHSLASEDLVATIIANKYELALPLYRQRQRLKELGLSVSEATLSNWVIFGSERVALVDQLLFRKLKQQPYLHGDETPIQVLREPGKSATSKSFLWEMRSAANAATSIIHFHYDPSRSEKVARAIYEGFNGTLVCDGYAGYNHIPPGIRRAGCWAHGRRKFVDGTNGIESQRSLGRKFVKKFDQLFAIERKAQGFSPQQLLEIRQRESKPIVDSIWQLMSETTPINKSKLGRAYTYMVNQREQLEVFLNDPGVAISNNIAERSIKTSVIGRKNWLFSTGQRGAKANALFLGLFETAIANHLDFKKYLVYLFTYLPRLGDSPTDEELEAYLPWAKAVQQSCAA